MGIIFKKEHIRLILRGVKTQTRRKHKWPLKRGKIYDIKRDWYHSTGHKILITNVFRQRLGDITPDEALKEGDYTLDEFKGVWSLINGNWDPDDVVWVYEFKLVNPPSEPKSLNRFLRKIPMCDK